MDKFKDSLKNILGKMVPGKESRGAVVDKFKGAFATNPEVKILAKIEKKQNQQFLLVQTIQDSIRRIEEKVVGEEKKSFGKKIFEFLKKGLGAALGLAGIVAAITGLNKLPKLLIKGLSGALSKMGLGKIANMLKGPSTPSTLTKPTTGPGGLARKVTVTNIKPIPVIEAGLPGRNKGKNKGKPKGKPKGPQTKGPQTKPTTKGTKVPDLPDQTRSNKQLNLAQDIADKNKGPSKLAKFGKGALKAARFLGPAGAILGAGMAVGDAVQGYGDEATAENLGIEGRDPTTGEKASSAAGSLLSGLTLGLLDKGTASKAIAGFFGAGPDAMEGIDPDLVKNGYVNKEVVEELAKNNPTKLKVLIRKMDRRGTRPSPLLKDNMSPNDAYDEIFDSPEAEAAREEKRLKGIASGEISTIPVDVTDTGEVITRKVTAEDVKEAQRKLDEKKGGSKGESVTVNNVDNSTNQAPPPPAGVKPQPRKGPSSLDLQLQRDAVYQ
ncbi:hypothetical protein [Marinobacter sp.]|uniref:hypothetical protein n=1 Tax=Marinobacter sp. TaxID=50741 RepID=UPI002580508D|nr:hypothetical protein [Marinobacter sp.]|tara:strand:+ start:1503 stop:2984 length:1482 start_codon:yes stop_codon:yes gene_type:complete